MPCVQLGYRETKGLRHLLWIRLCRVIVKGRLRSVGSKWVFEPTANIVWTYRVTHIEWAGNQPLGLKLVFKPKGSLGGFIHSFSRLREVARVFERLNPVLAHSFLSRFPRRLVCVDSYRGWSDPVVPFSLTRRV